MATILKQSTAVDVLIGPFVDITDGATAETGETPTVKLSKNGQALAAKNDATTPVSDADGYYNCEFDATDTNTVGSLVLTVAATATALPIRHEYQVVEEAVYDAFYAASAAGIPSIPASWITAAGIATDAIGAAELATDAVTEIQSGLALATELAKVPKSDSTVSWNATALAAINAEVVDTLNTDTYAEPSQGAPGATVSLAAKIGFLYKAWRNRSTQTSSQYSLYNDDATTVDHKATTSDNGTTADKGEVATGP